MENDGKEEEERWRGGFEDDSMIARAPRRSTMMQTLGKFLAA
jgi:hypothetical protein